MLILVTTLGFLLGRDPALEQRLLHSTLAEFPIIGNQLQGNIHSLRANGIGLVVGLAGFVWGRPRHHPGRPARHGRDLEHPGKQCPSSATRQLRGLLLLLAFGLGVVATTALASLASVGGPTLLFDSATCGQLLLGASVAGVLFPLLRGAGGYLVGHSLKHAQQVHGFFAIVLGLMPWLY